MDSQEVTHSCCLRVPMMAFSSAVSGASEAAAMPPAGASISSCSGGAVTVATAAGSGSRLLLRACARSGRANSTAIMTRALTPKTVKVCCAVVSTLRAVTREPAKPAAARAS
ncbi:hypothetical protein D3C86_1781980 [compost metagenome]